LLIYIYVYITTTQLIPYTMHVENGLVTNTLKVDFLLWTKEGNDHT